MPSPDTSVAASSRTGVDDGDHHRQKQYRQEPALAASAAADGDSVNGDDDVGSRQPYFTRPSNVVTTSRCCSSIHHVYGCCSSRRSRGNNTSQTSSSDTTSSSGGGYIQSLLTPTPTGSGKDDATTRSIRAINVLRCLMITFLIVTTSLMCSGIYMYANQKQHELFCNNYQHGSIKIMKTFHTHIQTSLMSLETLSKTIISHAQSHNLTFPFVTVPNFELHGVNVRILSKSHVIHYMPLIYDSNREEWEEYALNHRAHIDVAFQNDLSLRLQQDEYFEMQEKYRDDDISSYTSNLKKKKKKNNDARRLQGNQGGGGDKRESPWNETILDDGTGYHPKIWSIGAMDPHGDYPTTTNGGPYLPLWQRSPISGAKQAILNMNFAQSHALNGTLDKLLTHGSYFHHDDHTATDHQGVSRHHYHAILNAATFPVPAIQQQLEANLLISQYRDNIDDYINDPSTFLTYPILLLDSSTSNGTKSQQQDRLLLEEKEQYEHDSLVGVLAINLYWKLLFSDILSGSDGDGYICVVENSYGQTFAYRLDGPEATYLGLLNEDDDKSKSILASNKKYKHMEVAANIDDYMKEHASPKTQSYTAISLSDYPDYVPDDSDDHGMGRYTLRIYPSWDTERKYVTNQPWLYMMVVVVSFVLTSCIFLLFSYYVEQRQQRTSQIAIDAAQSAAKSERELNEFLSHEVRNPLSAAISACSFVTATIEEEGDDDANQLFSPSNVICKSSEKRKVLIEDVEVIRSSLNYINDFLRSMLDLQRCATSIDPNNPLQHRPHGLITLHPKPTDIVHDIFEPISTMLFKRDVDYKVIIGNGSDSVSCNSCLVLIDTLRLKQVIMNLVRNSTKFVEHGFVRMRVEVVDDICHHGVNKNLGSNKEKSKGFKIRNRMRQRRRWNTGDRSTSNVSVRNQQQNQPLHRSQKRVRIYIEDSGPGISLAKQSTLFTKYQASLDVLSQGTGVGLCLSKNLMLAMGGDLWYDDTYDSGVDGCPGARFVVDLNVPPITMADNDKQNAAGATSAVAIDELIAGCHQQLCGGTSVSSTLGEPEPVLLDGSEQIDGSSTKRTEDSSFRSMFDVEVGVPTDGQNLQRVKQLPTNLKVLFVDDDVVLRKLFARAIRKVAPTWTIREAASGEIAIQLCRNPPTHSNNSDQEAHIHGDSSSSSSYYDLIFMDQYMASVDKQLLGTETVRSLRKAGITSKIIGLSANNLEDSFLHAGADFFRLKPLACDKVLLEQELLSILDVEDGANDGSERSSSDDVIIDC